MNLQEAYMQGFCKTAEAYGVDPNVLIKQAIYPELLNALRLVTPGVARGNRSLAAAMANYLRLSSHNFSGPFHKGGHIGLAKLVARLGGIGTRTKRRMTRKALSDLWVSKFRGTTPTFTNPLQDGAQIPMVQTPMAPGVMPELPSANPGFELPSANPGFELPH